MKQKDGDKHKPSTSYSSNKGKRKLEFDKKTSNLPLSGKIVYLDVKDVRQSRSLEEKLKQLGGTIEKFLIKDVNYVISSNAPASGQKKGEKGQDRPDSPAFQSTPSPFSMGQSPSPTAIEAKKETVTRGKAILQIAKNKSSQTSVADTAKKMGIKIVSLNGAITWLDKEIRKIKPAPVSTSNKQETRRRGTKVQRLKTPYVKFEAESCHYRPIMQQLKTWPHFNTETPQGTCPFDGRALGRPQNSERGDREEVVGVGNVLSPGTPQAQRDELSGAQQVKSQSKTAKLDEPSNCKMFGVPIVTAGEIKRERERRKRELKRKGYCECCKEKYDYVDKHMRGLQHKNFARNKKNFDCIDTLIHKGPNTVSFLQRILLRHCVQKAANRNKDCSSQACDDGEVLLIEECSEKQSEKGGASNLPPEQLRVKRKMNRRLKYDRKIEKVTVEKTKLNKNVETCESRLGIVLDGQHHHHSSPRKPRSGSFPRVGRESCELESTSAVVIRRSGSRGLYGSPRRSQSASGSEKTLIIRDSPIASLQPLKDFLKRHSTNTCVRDGEKSSRFDEAAGKESRKRKSGASSSPVQEEKRHRQSDQTPVGDSTSGEVVLTKCNRPDGKKGGSDAVSDKIVHSQLEKCVKDKPDREHSRVTRSSPRKRLDIDIESKVTSPRKSNRLSFQTENMSPLSDIVMKAENVIELSSKSVVVISKLDMESADSQLSLTSAGSPRWRSWKNKQKDSYCESEHVESHDDQGRVVGDDPDSKDIRCKSRSKPRKYRDCGNDSEVEVDVIVEKSTEVDEQRSRSKKRKDRDCGKSSQVEEDVMVEMSTVVDGQRSRSKKRKDRDCGKGSQADDEADVEEFKEKDDQRSRSKKRKDRDCGKGSQADDEADVEEFKEKDDQRSRSKKRKDRDCGKGSQVEEDVNDCDVREARRSCSKQKKHKDSREESVAQNKSDMNVECSNPGGKDIDSHKSRSPHMKKHGSKTHSDFIQNEADSIELSPTKGRSNSKKALRPSPNPDNKIQPTEVSTSSRTSPRKKHRTLEDLDVKSKDTNPSQEKTKADSKMLRADTAGEMVICNNETVVFTKRKKWKKVVRSSPQNKGRKLCKLKLDETSCSDYSCTSTMTSDVTPRKNAIPEQGESQSPVFKRRSRHSIKDLSHDVKENPESVELELKTPKRGKFCKKGDIENEEGGTEVATPKSGYCTTPRRRDRSWRSLRSNLVDETVCDGEDRRGEKDVKYVPETTPVKRVMMSRSRTSDTEMCCSPSRSRRARKSDESYQDMSEDKSTERKCSKISDSPRSRSRSTRNKPFEYGENAASASVPPSPNETLKKSRSTSTEKSPKRRKSSSPKKKETRGKRKWRQSKPSSRRKTVKLNRSWLILSERSMSKLLESEGDTQPFLGFQKEESDSRLPSDLTYEEVSEVDMSDDSTREWVMDEPDQDDEHRNDTEKNQGEDDIDNLWFPQFFPSPDKASNSSWGEACDSFLQTACERRLSGQTCSTPLVLPSNKVGTPRMRNKSPYCSPHRQLDTVKEDEDLDKTLVASDSYETPKKSRKISPRNLNRDESDDKGIVYNFNYRSPQKASRQDTGHERFRATTSRDDGLCLEYNKSVDSSGRKLRLLKKASSTKKTFHMSYVSKPVKSPKPARRINISAASTVVVVSPKGKLK